MGPLLVGAAGLMWGGRGCCGPWFRRRPRRFAPAALGGLWGAAGSCGALRLLPGVTAGP